MGSDSLLSHLIFIRSRIIRRSGFIGSRHFSNISKWDSSESDPIDQ